MKAPLVLKKRPPRRSFVRFLPVISLALFFSSAHAYAAAPSIPFTVTMSEAVTIGSCSGSSCPYLSLNVGGNTRSAYCPSVSNSTTLTCTYTATAGDLDLDGISFVDTNLHANSISITDQNGNALTNFAFTPPANISAVKVSYPSLSMDFSNGSTGRYTLNGTAYTSLPSFLSAAGGTYSRGSVGTYFDSTGTLQTAAANTARFDYDPSTLAFKGLLIEEARTNLLSRSSEIDNLAAWFWDYATVTADTTTSPQGTITADKLVEDTNSNIHRIGRQTAVTSGTDYTFSVFLKAAGRNFAQVRYENSGATMLYLLNVNLSNGSYTTGSFGSPTGTNAVVDNVGNGWYRCQITVTTSDTVFYSLVYAESALGTYNYAGNGSSGLYIWGAQLEQGTYATSYIPTTSSSVARSSDLLTIPTGAWFSSTGTTVYGSFRANNNNGAATYRRVIGTVGATNANYGELSNPNSYIRLYNNTASLDQASTSILTGETYAASSSGSGRSLSVHGAAAVTDSAIVPAFTAFALGSQNGTGNFLNGTIAKFKYYPLRVSDSQLQFLSQ